MKNFFTILLFLVIIGVAGYFLFGIIANNKDAYEKLYDKYSHDSSFNCKISKCTSESSVLIKDVNYSLKRELNIYDRAYYYQLKGNGISFNGSYNLIEEEKHGVVFPAQIGFTFIIGDINYVGTCSVSDHSISLTPSSDNYDYNDYFKHEANALEFCEYIFESVKSDLDS